MSHYNSYVAGSLYCFAATITWGCMFPIMTKILQSIDPFMFTALRYSLVCLMFIALLYIEEGKDILKFEVNKFLLWLFGSAGFAGFGFFAFLGQKLAGSDGALIASIIMATTPILGLLINWILKGARPSVVSLGFFVCSFLGVLLVVTKGHINLLWSINSNYVANLLLLIAAIFWSMYTIGGSYLSKLSPIKYTAYTTLFSLPTIYIVTAVLLVCKLIQFPSLHVVETILPGSIYMVLVAGFVGVLFWNKGKQNYRSAEWCVIHECCSDDSIYCFGSARCSHCVSANYWACVYCFSFDYE